MNIPIYPLITFYTAMDFCDSVAARFRCIVSGLLSHFSAESGNTWKQSTTIKRAFDGMTIDIEGSASPEQLAEYSHLFRQWLSTAKDFETFIQRASDSISKLGFTDWCYARLDVPNQVSAQASADQCIGNVDEKYLVYFVREKLFKWDIMPYCLRTMGTPLYQSTIEQEIGGLKNTNSEYENFQELVKIQKSFGYNDFYCIPNTDDCVKGSFVFGLTSKNLGQEQFQEYSQRNTPLLKVISESINDVGIVYFSEEFLGAKNRFDAVTSTQGFKLLVDTARSNMTYVEAAERHNLNVNTVETELSVIRRMVGAQTNLGAIKKLMDVGYFE